MRSYAGPREGKRNPSDDDSWHPFVIAGILNHTSRDALAGADLCRQDQADFLNTRARAGWDGSRGGCRALCRLLGRLPGMGQLLHHFRLRELFYRLRPAGRFLIAWALDVQIILRGDIPVGAVVSVCLGIMG